MKTSETLYQLAITMGSRFEQYPHHSFSENQYFLIIELWSEPRWETWRTELRSSDILMIFTSRGGGFRLDFLQRQIAVFDKNRNNVCSCLKTSQKSKAWGSAVIPEGSGMNFRVDHWKRSTDSIGLQCGFPFTVGFDDFEVKGRWFSQKPAKRSFSKFQSVPICSW